MAYPTDLLNSHEKVVVDDRPHWLYFMEPALSLLVAILALGFFAFNTDGSLRSVFTSLIGIVIVGLLVWTLVRFATWRTVDFVVTTDRVIYRSGVFAKRGIEIPLGRVNNVNFNQGILERIVGAGNLMIESGGEEGQSHFTDIHNPQTVQKIIHQEIDNNRHRNSGLQAAAAPPPPPAMAAPMAGPAAAPGPLSVADELEKLEGLLQRGVISPAQFELQKQRLLGG
jgi:membrane protein YdbS with pleckstrin-like domain